MILGLLLFMAFLWIALMMMTKEGRFIVALYFCVAILLLIAYLIRSN